MSSQFRLGRGSRGVFQLPNELAGRRSFVCGVSGTGKSNTATVCVEGLVRNGEQVVLIDPKGEGWGLQSSFDGKGPGIDVIVFGKPHGDIPELNEEHGERLADFVVESGRSVMLSLLGFDTDNSERRFVTRFFKRLYRNKTQQTSRTRTLVVLEEAHLFVPEGSGAGFKGEMAEMVGAIQRIVRQGRSFGLGTMLVDQRPQDVSKKLVSQCELLLIHNLTHNLDRKNLKLWTDGFGNEKQQRELLDTLATLQPGESWVWSPAWVQVFDRVKIDRRTTFDSGATPDGGSASQPTVRTKVDLESLRGQLAEVVEHAKANDPKALKAEIARLAKELEKKPATVAADPVTKAVVDQKAIDRAVATAVKDRDRHWKGEVSKLDAALKDRGKRLERILQTATLNGDSEIVITQPPGVQAAPISPEAWGRNFEAMAKKTTPVGMIVPRKASPPSTEAKIGGVHQRILDAIAWWNSIGVERPDGMNVALLSGYSNVKSTGFTKALGTLRSGGLLEGFQLTSDGFDAANHPGGSASLDELHERLLKIVSPKEQDFLRIVIERVRIPREALMEAMGYTNEKSTGFTKMMGHLRSMGFIDYAGRDVVATSLVFPEGLS